MVFRRFRALVLQDLWNFLRRVWFNGALFLWGRVGGAGGRGGRGGGGGVSGQRTSELRA